MKNSITFEIIGEPASKANARQKVMVKGRVQFIKSRKALGYKNTFQRQCPRLKELITSDVSVEMLIYYASRRPDLDESLILDCMEGFIYANDRQVREKHMYWGLDKKNPRTVIRVSAVSSVVVPDYLLV